MTESGRELLQARADLLRVLLRPHAVLVCMYPRLLVLSLQSNLRPPASPPDMRITSTLAEATAVLDRAEKPLLILATELLADGQGLELIRRAKQRSGQHRCLLVLTHNHRVVVEDARAAGTDVLVLEESLGRGGTLVYGVEQLSAAAAASWIRPSAPPGRNRRPPARPRGSGCGSRSGSAPSWPWWPMGSATGRSASGSTSPRAPPATTCRPSCGAWG